MNHIFDRAFQIGDCRRTIILLEKKETYWEVLSELSRLNLTNWNPIRFAAMIRSFIRNGPPL